MSLTQNLFQQAQLSEAAYANFVDSAGNLLTNPDDIRAALQDAGNNMRFSPDQATAFVSQWQVVNHIPDTASGFSATLFERRDASGNGTGEFDLAIRGSTFDSGLLDFRVDAGDIFADGVALDQLVDLYNYWQRLRTPSTSTYNAAKLVTLQAETLALRAAYVLGPAAGLAVEAALRARANVIIDLPTLTVRTIQFVDSSELSDASLRQGAGFEGEILELTVSGHSLGGHLAMAFTRLFSGANASALAVNGLGFSPTNSNVDRMFRLLGGSAGFDAGKIYNVFGLEGPEFAAQNTALLKQVGGYQGIFIESAAIFAQALGHSAVQMTDSLAIYDLFAKIDPALNTTDPAVGIGKITDVLKAASNKPALSLEAALDSLRRLFKDPAVQNFTPTVTDNREQFYKNLYDTEFQNRISAYTGLLSIESLVSKDVTTIEANAFGDIGYRYALKALNPFVVLGEAGIYEPHNLSRELDVYDPVSGNGTLTPQWVADRAKFLTFKLDANSADRLFALDPAGANAWYQDRALRENAYVVTSTGLGRSSAAAFEAFLRKTDAKRIFFGSESNDSEKNALDGGGKADFLYGGGGDDRLNGRAGNDYLQGDAGDDVLNGGTENDTLFGGKDADVLDGGLGNDTYVWNRGDGFDTITDAREADGIKSGTIQFLNQSLAGTKTQFQPDNPQLFTDERGILYALTGTPGVDGMLTVVKPLEEGGLHLAGFKSGDFGIVIPVPTGPTKTVKEGTAQSDNSASTQPGHEATLVADAPNQKVFGHDGNDLIIVAQPGAEAYGGPGHDYIKNDTGDQKLFGEAGNDILIASGGNDELYGGLDNDALQGGADDDYLEGGEGNDFLDGGTGSDVIVGGPGHDFILGGGNMVPAITEGEIDDPNVRPFGVLVVDGVAGFTNMVGFPDAAGDGTNTIDAGEGADTVFGGEAEDFIDGGTGNDLLVGLSGQDSILGGGDNDSIFGDGTQGHVTIGGQDIFTFPEFHAADYLDGGAGDDFLTGDGGNDELIGGEGADTLIGDATDLAEEFHGADYLDGGAGNDTLLGYGKDDTLFGGADDDELGGDSNTIAANLHGDDYLDGEDGNDILHGDGGSDILFGGAGDDTLEGDALNLAFEARGDDYLDGEDGNDVLQGSGGSDQLFGGAGNDSLVGDALGVPVAFAGDDFLDGGAGDDALDGGAGTDTLTGGPGADILIGGDGDDIYLANLGDNQDFIQDLSGANIVRFGAGITASGISVSQALGSDGKAYLLMSYSGNQLFVQNGSVGGVTRYELADGSALTQAQMFAKMPSFQMPSVFGTSGADTLAGTGLAERFFPGTGNDTILFGRGSGADVTDFRFQSAQGGQPQQTDRIQLAAGITPADLKVTRVSGGLTLTIRDTSDRISYSFGAGFSEINDALGGQVFFADGTVWLPSHLVAAALGSASEGNDTLIGGEGAETIDGGAGDDILFGDNPINPASVAGNDTLLGGEGNDNLSGLAGNDSLDGGPGDDRLSGGFGTDTYLYGAGDGNDVVENSGFNEGNIVQFKPGVAPADVTLLQGSIVVSLNETGETLTLDGWYSEAGFASSVTNSTIIDPRFTVEVLRFADGTVWDTSTINEKANHATPFSDLLRGIHTDDTLHGLAGDDVIEGFSGDDVLTGGHGNDTLRGGIGADDLDGGAGNDVLDGGQGNDVLAGGDGNDTLDGGSGDDTYLIASGSGVDSVRDASGGADLLVLPQEILPGDVTVRYLASQVFGQSAVVLELGSAGQVQLMLATASDLRSHGIEALQFADGTVWTPEDLIARVVAAPGTEANDQITGTANSDTIDAGGGNDIVEGSFGTDILRGGDGDDQLFAYKRQVFAPEPLGDDVANQLFGGAGNDSLTGSTGTDLLQGDEGNDSLTGADGADTLIGGDGIDSLVAGAGNDVLDGGAGNDDLRGGFGDDVYVFGHGSGHDSILDATFALGNPNAGQSLADELNVIAVDADLTPADVSVSRSGANLVVATRDGLASVTVVNWFDQPDPARLEVRFADGTAWNSGTLLALAGPSIATDGNDLILGSGASETLSGLGGNDTLRGNSGDDVLDGGAGDDTLAGGFGNDTYLFGYGSGQDVVFEHLTGGNPLFLLTQAAAGERDRIVFGAGVRPADVLIDFNASTEPVFRLAGTQDTLRIGGWSDTVNRIEFAEFEDGTIWDLGKWNVWSRINVSTLDIATGSDRNFGSAFADTPSMGIHDGAFFGLGGNDTLRDSAGHNLLYGGDGNDTLSITFTGTGTGDDVYDGGAGNDTLSPGTGDNVIRFGRGAGQDTLNLAGLTGITGTETILLGQDVRPEHVKLRQGVTGGVIIELTGTPDSLNVNGSIRAADGTGRLRLAFADGTVWNTEEIEARFQTAAVVEGGTGNNVLFGGDGDEIFVGGEGNDTITGAGGSDTYVFQRGDGQDTIFDTFGTTSSKNTRIVFREGIALQDLSFFSSPLDSFNEDLIIQVAGGGGSVTVKNYFTTSGLDIAIELADGTVLDSTFVGARVPFFVFGTYTGTPGDDTFVGPAGAVELRGLDGNDTLTGNAARLLGGSGNDALSGGDGGNDLRGEAGDDALFGGSGNDVLQGGDGNDLLDAGVDALAPGQFDNDSITGGSGNDVLIGRVGGDSLNGDAGDDTLDGGADNDALSGGAGADTLLGGAGNDVLEGGSGDDLVDGGTGDDRLYGGAGSDTYLFGIGSGRDTLVDFDVTGTALDTVRVGPGIAPADISVSQEGASLVLRIVPSGDSLTIRTLGRGGYGIERVVFEDGTEWDATQLLNLASLNLAGERADVIFGSAGDDTLSGLGGDDIVEGGGGADLLSGDAGDDILIGGAGGDMLDGGFGPDHLVGGEGSDTFVVNIDSESDTIADLGAGDTVTFGAGIVPTGVQITRDVAHLYLGIGATGQLVTLENWFANGAQGTIAFADGSLWDGAFLKATVDALTDGDDFFLGTPASELISALAGSDTVFAAAGDDQVMGGAGSDMLQGESGNDLLFGEAGFDTISGGDGNDTLDGGTEDDALSGDAGDDTLSGGDGFDTLAGGAGADALDGGIGEDTLQGDAGDDTLLGGEGIDTLAGGDGADTLEGGAGDDLLDGGAGADTYAFAPGFGSDIVSETNSSTAEIDALRIGGVAPEDVNLKWIGVGTEVQLEITGSADRLVIRNPSNPTFPLMIERIEFDSVVWNQSDIFAHTVRYLTEGNDSTSIGSFKGLIGLGGNDTLNGSENNDLLDGGDGTDNLSGSAGNDQLLGGRGTDTLNGGDGADQLFGGEDADSLVGGNGDDLLDGGAGNDTLNGGGGNDIYVFGVGYGDDVISNFDITAGRVDVLTFTAEVAPVDVLVERVDVSLRIVLSGGADRLRVDNWFGGPEWQLSEARFADGTVWSAANLEARIVRPAPTEGDDVLLGLTGNDVIDALGGNDSLDGGFGDDILSGGSGDDLIFGRAGMDRLDGGSGNDVLDGGTGNDTYVFGPGAGFDSVSDVDSAVGNVDIVLLNALPSDVVVSEEFSNLLLTLSGGGDQLTLQSWFFGDAQRIEEVRLADGTVWDVAALSALANGLPIGPRQGTNEPDNLVGTPGADLLDGLAGDDTLDGQGGNDTLSGGADNDTLLGGAGQDILDGGTGDDALIGGSGNDVYRFGAGYGSDSINEFDSTAGNSDTVEVNGPAADAAVRRAGANLELRLASGDVLTSVGWFSGSAQKVEVVRFTDGTTWDVSVLDTMANAGFTYTGTDDTDFLSGSDGPDTLEGLAGHDFLDGLGGDDMILGGAGFDSLIGGAGNDVLAGGQDDDTLQGGLGDDVYRFAAGDGSEFVVETGGSDTVEFGSGVAPADVSVLRTGNNLVLTVAGGAGQLTLSGWFANAASKVEQVRFADGTVWSEGFLLHVTGVTESGDFIRGSGLDDVINALGGDDTVYGGPGNDDLRGGAGDDVLGGEAGADTLDGGTGRDLLFGDAGDDRYVFDAAYGDDWIVDTGGADEVVFGPALAPASLILTRDLSNLYMTVGTDRLTLVDWFAHPDSRVEVFRFTDGTVLGESDVRNGIRPALATSLDDTIFGSDANDALSGSSGEDTLYGEAGDDILDGGQGSDYLVGGRGDDTYHVDHRLDRVTEDPGEGSDTIVAAASYTLSSNVENLTLSGVAAINGTGNAFDNVITGNWAANILDGGPGNDSLRGGVGNDAYFFGRTDGVDEIVDVDNTTGNQDEVRFEVGIAPSQVLVSRVVDDIRLRVADGGDVFLRNWFDPVQKIESVKFADGTIWDAPTIEFLANQAANESPVLEQPIEDQTAPEDMLFTFTLPPMTFVDPDAGDLLTYTATRADESALPSWISFDAGTQTFSGTPVNADVGTISVKITATDGSNLSVSDIFDLTVTNTNDVPVLANAIADQTATEDVAFSFALPANTFADVDVGDALTYNATLANGSALPSWLTFDTVSRTFSGTPANADVGAVSVRVTATDGSNASVSDVFDLAVANTNDPPVAVADSVAVNEDATTANLVPLLLANDTDVDAGDTRSITAINTTGTVGTVAFNAATQMLTYSADAAAQDALAAGATATDQFAYTVADAQGASSSAAVTVTVTGVNDAPVLATPIADQNATENQAFSFQVPGAAFSDVDVGDALAYSATLADGSPLPSWLVFEAASRTFTGTPGHADIGAVNVQVVAMDTQGAFASDVFNIDIAQAPIVGTPSNDFLVGTAGNDTILGLAGHDLLNGAAGADKLIGGSGNDIYVVDNTGDAVTESPSEGIDGVLSSVSFTLSANVEVLTLTGTAAINGTGNELDNVLTGNSATNVLTGRLGNDYYYASTGDTVVEAANAGSDTVVSDVSWSLGANLENLILVGSAAISGTGNELDNILTGSSAANALTGGAGDDTFFIGASDTVVESAGGGEDLVNSSVTHTLGANVEHLVLTGTTAINGTGNGLNNLLRGNSAVNTLAGAAGNDVLEGGAGNDTLGDTSGANLFSGQAGTDTLSGNTGNELFIGGAGNDTINTGAGADIIAFNRGEGSDTVAVSTVKDNSVSLGGGIAYADLFFQKSGNNLLLKTAGAAASEGITFTNWYAAAANRSVLNMQMIVEASADFDATSADALRNKKVAEFNFDDLVAAFDAARSANPALTSWALTNALLDFHFSGSDTEALGGDLAYQHGRFGNLANVGTVGAQNVLGGSQFGSATQTFQPLSSLQEGLVKLS